MMIIFLPTAHFRGTRISILNRFGLSKLYMCDGNSFGSAKSASTPQLQNQIQRPGDNYPYIK